MAPKLIAIIILLSIPPLWAEEAVKAPKAPLISILSSDAGFSMTNSGCGGDEGHLADVQCLGKYLRWLDGEMNQTYKRVLKQFPEKDAADSRKEREQLRKSQRAWLKYKNDNCTLVGAIEGGSNLWVTHFAALCEEREVKDRIKFLEKIAIHE